MERPRIRKRTSIRSRFLSTVLLTTIFSILAVSFIGAISIRFLRINTRRVLSDQLELNLKNVAQEHVDTIEAKLAHYEKYIEFLTDSIENMYANEEELISYGKTVSPPTGTHEYSLYRIFASPKLREADLRRDIRFFSNLEPLWNPIARENSDMIATLYLGTASGLLLSYDRYSYLSCPEAGKELIYNYYHSEWYQKGIKAGGVVCTGVYMDFQGRGLTITLASRFMDSSGEPAGVVCMDFDLSALYSGMFAPGLEDGVFTFVLDQYENIIAPDSDTLDLQAYTGLTLDELEALEADTDGIMEKGNSVYVCLPIQHTGWTLCASVPKDAILQRIHDADFSIWRAVIVYIVLVLLVLISAVIAVNRGITSVTRPLIQLERDIKIISDGDLKYRASVYSNDEIGDITSRLNEMVDRLNFTMNELKSAQRQADAMGRLATLDSLTGVRNKTAFDRQFQIIADDLEKGAAAFGFAMLDLNNLKVINDNFGHDKGDLAIKNLCHIICEVFAHSPVFRVGGDEFVVVLKGGDYQDIEALVKLFKEKIHSNSAKKNAPLWESISAAIGYALYDEKLDDCPESVLARADKEMYRCKKSMKEQ